MAFSYNIDEVPAADAPTIEHDVLCAKMYLQRCSLQSGDNLYDHLRELICKILSERPENAVDIFEEYSKKLKTERYKSEPTHIRDVYVPPAEYENAKKLIKLFQSVKPVQDVEESMDDEESDKKRMKPNMMELLYYFEQTDIGLPRSEMVLLNLSIRKFMTTYPVENVRFWGKIFGNPKNYYVLEAELLPEELEKRIEQLETEIIEKDEETGGVVEDREKEKGVEVVEETEITGERGVETTEAGADESTKPLELIFPPMPVNTWTSTSEIPSELIGTGANQKVYFVCNRPGLDDWIELPMVTPLQIIVARQIIRSFTGNLDTKIHTYPPFPGTERHYLRAQIARISAATQVSPVGFYTTGSIDEEEEEEEEEMGEVTEAGELTENIHYDPLPLNELVDSSLTNWCHHTPYLLKSGRITWWNPKAVDDKDLDEEAVEDEEEEEKEILEEVKEKGPPLLTPLSEDAVIDSTIPWSARISSNIQPDIAVAIIRSHIWPGAFAFSTGKKCANIYIGWGQKYTAYNYSPTPMPSIEDQYKVGPEILEMQDPSFEDEENWRIAHQPPTKPETDEEEDDEDEDNDDEEDEEDDE